MTLAHSSLPSEGHRLFLQLRSELHAVLCTRSRPAQPLLEPDWRSSSDLTCISSSTRTWDRAAGERDQRSGEIELAEKNRIEPFVLLDLARLVIRFSSSSFSPLACCRGSTRCGGQSLLSPELHDHAPSGPRRPRHRGGRAPGARIGTGAAPEPPKTPLGLLGLVLVAGGSRTARYWAVWAPYPGDTRVAAACAIAV